MEITIHEIPIRDLVDGYADNDEEGVVAYHGLLNVRPKYQRNFIYDVKDEVAVIRSIQKNYPINVMYWAVNEDGTYEMLDGQQRTMSICQYYGKQYSIESIYFQTLTKEEQDQFLDYKLQIYFCEGTDKEKLEWFKIINIATKVLTNQELRNAIYTGPWLTDAKRKFSKRNCVASLKNDGLVSGDPNRQLLLEQVLDWAAQKDGVPSIEEYMAIHQHDKDANALWLYFQEIIDWVRRTFPVNRPILKGQDWGELYNEYHKFPLNSDVLEKKIQELLLDDDVTNKKGIILYLLSGQDKYLNIRAFTPAQKLKMYEAQGGICPICHKHFELSEMEADHCVPWSKGGKTELQNGQMLCRSCNEMKSAGKLNPNVINVNEMHVNGSSVNVNTLISK